MSLSFEESLKNSNEEMLATASFEQEDIAEEPVSIMAFSMRDVPMLLADNEGWTKSTNLHYKYTDEGYSDEEYSIIDKNKNIVLNQNQINITQESNSQYIPFQMPRRYDGYDLAKTTISIFYVNKNKNYAEVYPVDVYYNEDTIKFAWLVNETATSVSGTLQFEIHAEGENQFVGGAKEKYVWKSKSIAQINIIQSLKEIADGEIGLSKEEATNLLSQITELSKTILDNVDAANKLLSDTNKRVEELEDGIEDEVADAIDSKVAPLLEGLVEDAVSDKMKNYYTTSETYTKNEVNTAIASIDSKFGTLGTEADGTTSKTVVEFVADKIGELGTYENGATIETVVGYVTEALKDVDISAALGDIGTKVVDGKTVANTVADFVLGKIGDLGTYKNDKEEDVNIKTVVEYVTRALENVNIDNKLGTLKVGETTYDTVVDFVKAAVNNVDVSGQLALYALKADLETVSSVADSASQNSTKNAENIETINTSIEEIEETLSTLEGDNDDLIVKYDESGSVLRLYKKDENGAEEVDGFRATEISYTTIIGAGGGGEQSVSTIKIGISPHGSDTSTVLYGNKVYLDYELSTKIATDEVDANGRTIYKEGLIAGDITITLFVDNIDVANFVVTKVSSSSPDIDNIDITEHVSSGKHTYSLRASYTEKLGNGESISVKSYMTNWIIDAVDFEITNLPSSDWESTIKHGGESFIYTPVGKINKTIYIKIDDNDPEITTTNINGGNITYYLPKLSHGIHTLEIWGKAFIGGTNLETEHYKYILMFVEEGNEDVIIRIKAPEKAEQYSLAPIYYNVYDPNNGIIDRVVLYDEDGKILSTKENITSAEQRFDFRPLEDKNKTITVDYNGITESVEIEVTKFPYEINPITDSLVLDFIPTGRTNGDVDYNIFKNGDNANPKKPITWELSENFDWVNGGWKTDSNTNDSYFCIKAGTFVNINYELFGTDDVISKEGADGKRNLPGTGKEFKIIFKTTNVARADATWLECIDKADNTDLGIKMEAQNAYIESSAGTLEVPYTDEDIIEFDMNIIPYTKFDKDTDSPDTTVKTIPMIITYEDGTPVQPKVISSIYTKFKQDNPKVIKIGSDSCDVYIYRIKAYERYLEDREIITNFIADARSGTEMSDRYIRNDIYPEGNKEKITPESVARACPGLKVYVLSAPYFTKDKKEKVENTTVRQICNTGTREKPLYDIEQNWKAIKAIHNGQGTTSNEYGYSGRNLEFNMKKAEILLGDNISKVSTIRLSDTSYPTNYLNFKINIASSECSNNALLQKRYDRYLPYTSIASLLDDRKKNSMEFYNCVVFIQETNEDISTHREFLDTDIHFYGIGNIGDSKKTDDTRVNDMNDINEFCVEIMDWNRYLSSFPVDTKVATTYFDDQKNETVIRFKDFHTKDSLGVIYEYINNKYVKTPDRKFDSTKNYYVNISGEMTKIVEFVTKDNLSQLYEFENGSYNITSDLKINSSKIYYANIGGVMTPTIDLNNPKNFGILYELINGKYTKTEDVNLDSSKTYYVDILENDDFSEDYTYGFRYVQKEFDDKDADYKEKTEEFQRPLREKWIDFYRFVTKDLTTNGEEDKNKVDAWKSELSNWFILDSILYYYLYTLRYTMVDNRAKNTFWHWGKYYLTFDEAFDMGIEIYDKDKNRITDKADRPIECFNIDGDKIENINDAAAAINNGYRMEFWAYDNDTALGIDNAGKLEIPFGVEDNDTDSSGVPYFRANDSTVFQRIDRYFTAELEDVWSRTESNKVGKVFNSNSLIKEFDEWQSQFPEELWRLDYERKYKRTYVGGSGQDWDNAIGSISNNSDTKSTRFLTEMMNGKKKYQRRCFERNQEIFMSSRFKGEVNIGDSISLRGTGIPSDKAVPYDITLKIVPFSKMYVNLYNSTSDCYYHKLHNAGDIVIDKSYPGGNLDNLYIRGASKIQELGDLSAMYLQTATLTPGQKLKKIELGNEHPNYFNDRLEKLEIGENNKLLEELDIRGLKLSHTSFPVNVIPSLKRVYAERSNINEANFANNGLLEVAELPGTIVRLSLQNLKYLESVTLESCDNLLYFTAVGCSNKASDSIFNIVESSVNRPEGLSKLLELRLSDINWELADTTILDKLYALIDNYNSPKIILSGNVHVPEIKQKQYEDFKKVWPKLFIKHSTMIQQWPVYFVNPDGSPVLDEITAQPLVQYVVNNEFAIDPSKKDANGKFVYPSIDSTVEYDYEFVKWVDNITGQDFDFDSHILGSYTLRAVYKSSLRTYNIKYVTKTGSLTKSGVYGSNVPYNFDIDGIPTYTGEEGGNTFYLFSHWDKSGFLLPGENGNDLNGGEDGITKIVNAVYDKFQYVESMNEIEELNENVEVNGSYTRGSFKGVNLKDLKPVQIYALTKLGANNVPFGKYDDELGGYPGLSSADPYELNIGNDFDYSDIESDVLISEKTTFGTSKDYIEKDIKLFDFDKEFTLAVDYKFLGSKNGTLLQCYDSESGRGFRLYYSGGSVKFDYDNITTVIRSTNGADNHDVIVICNHYDFDNNKYVLSIYDSNLNNINIADYHMNRGVIADTDSKLIFGASYSYGAYTGYVDAEINWAKIWHKSLGEYACKSLAMWTRETIDMKFCGQRRYITKDVETQKTIFTSFSLASANLLEKPRRWHNNSTKCGWGDCELRKVLNERLYKAIPIKFRSLMKNMEVYGNNGTDTVPLQTSSCYITVPAIVELAVSHESTNFQSKSPYSEEMGKIFDDPTEKTISYFSNKDSRIMSYKQGGADGYWSRSPDVTYSTAYIYCIDSKGDVRTINKTDFQTRQDNNLHGIMIEISL